MKNVVAFIMAGGKGERLIPLTRDRTKPAVPFGGIYRIIDVTLSNCVNSRIRRIHVLIQYKCNSLIRHLRMGWNIFDAELGEYIDIVPAQMRTGETWYMGTADSIYQNLYFIETEKPDYVLILAGENKHVIRLLGLDKIKVLVYRIRGAHIPCLACPHLRRDDIDIFAELCVKDVPTHPQVPYQ